MNKGELIDAAASSSGLPKTITTRALDSILNVIGDTLSTGDQVVLIGFGTFGSKIRAARAGRNPKTGEVIEIKEACVPFFRPGKTLKASVEAVNELEKE